MSGRGQGDSRAHEYNTRSRSNANILGPGDNGDEEEQRVTSSPQVSSHDQRSSGVPVYGAPLKNTRAGSIVGSYQSSQNSFSQGILNNEVELQEQRELAELNRQEANIRLAMRNIDVEMEMVSTKIARNRSYLDDLTSMEDAKEVNERKAFDRRYQEELEDLQTKKRWQQITDTEKMAEITEKREILKNSAALEKMKIIETTDQLLDSEDEAAVVKTQFTDNNVELETLRTENFVRDAQQTLRRAEEADKEKVAKETLARENAALKAEALEKADIEFQSRIAQIKAVAQAAKDQSVRAREIAQEELDKKEAEAAAEILKLEEEYRALKVEKSSYCSNATGSKSQAEAETMSPLEQMILTMTQAFGKMTPVSPTIPTSDNNKFMARQSYSKDLPKFSGKVEEWLIFYAAYEQSTKDCEYRNSENLGRLQRCLVGEAAAYVRSLLVSPENVPTIIKDLKERYGQPEHIIRAMVDKARSLSSFQEERMESLIEFGSAVRNLTTTVKSLKRPEHLSNPQLQQELEDKLPMNLRMQWLRWVSGDTSRKKDLENFSSWISGEMALACQVIPTKGISLDKQYAGASEVPKAGSNKDKKGETTPKKTKWDDEVPTTAGLYAGDNNWGNKRHKNNRDEGSNWQDKSPRRDQCNGQERSSWKENRNEKEQQLKKGRYDCIFCSGPHNSSGCGKAIDMELEQKQKIIGESQVCFCCLKPNHWARDCTAFIKCVVCLKRHVSFMCPDLPSRKPPPPSTNAQAVINSMDCTTQVLGTLRSVLQERGRQRSARIFYDGGSNRNYITKRMANQLGLKSSGEIKLAHKVFGGVQTAVETHQVFYLKINVPGSKNTKEFKVLDKENLCKDVPRMSHGPWMDELTKLGIRITDLGEESSDIDVLLGADAFAEMITGRKYKLKNGLKAIETVLGWILMGDRTDIPHNGERSVAMTSIDMFVNEPENYWALEIMGIRDPAEVQSREEKDQKAKDLFQKNLSRNEDGRYCVGLPWIYGKQNIPTNRNIAEKRLESATKKINSADKYDQYDKIFCDWLQENIIEIPVDSKKVLNKIEDHVALHFIPHHPVFKPESLTTPIRPVFDASCKTLRTPSLNDCLEKGPNWMEQIPEIMLRFREKNIGIISDIRKAFQMIEVREEDRDYLRFLWWEDPTQKKLKEFRHKRVVFGVNCSPFLLAAVLEHHLLNVKEEDKNIAKKLLRSLYVDNCVTSEDTMEEYASFKERSISMMADAKMELRQWEFGSGEKSGISSPVNGECGLGFSRTHSSSGETINHTSVLGYRWDKTEDTLCCDFKCEPLGILNKRKILSIIQKVFDPIGFTSPTTIQPKIMIQELWKNKMTWDQELPPEGTLKFRKWWEGPSWLKLSSDHWPSSDPAPDRGSPWKRKKGTLHRGFGSL